MIRIFSLLLLPVCLLSQQEARPTRRPAEPAIEFTTTSNASQVGTSFVLGYQFSVRSPVMLNSLGAVLQGSAQPVFGALPSSMPVGLWDDAQNLLVSATVSASNPLIGHFRYAPVESTLLIPGVNYTIAGLVPAGRSALSDVPDMVAGSAIVYGGPRSLASKTLDYPAADATGLRPNYFGASFTYTGGASPVARSGRDLTVLARTAVKLDGAESFSTSGSLLTWNWALISVPPGSAAALSESDSATPSFVPDRQGVYVARLIVQDGSRHSEPSTVSITVTSAGAGGVAAVAQSAPDSLRQAFERTVYSLKNSGEGTWRGENRAQQLTVEFDSVAAHLSHPDGSVGVRLIGYGYGGQVEKPASVRPVATGNRVEYRRRNLTEWYINTPQGLEQGFTLAQRPLADRAGEPLIVALGISGDLVPAEKDGAVVLRSGKDIVLRYAGLTARDSRGTILPSRLEVSGHEIRLVVEDREAQYPLTIDPTWTQQAELTAADGLTNDNFGTSVAVDGTIAVIGSPMHKVGSHYAQGAAYVFVQSGTTWTQQAELICSGGAANDNFGSGVGVSGGTAVVGAPGHSNSQGAAYVFVQSGTTWTQQAELTSSDGAANDNFAEAVAVSGGTAVIGAYKKSVGGNSGQGASYVFVQSGTTWSQQAELTASDGAAGDNFGNAVSVSGGTAVIGAYVSNGGQGSAYVFVQSGTSWSQQAELTASDGAASDQFGHSVAVSGGTAVIGAYRHLVGGNSHQGAAYVFVQSGTTWSQQAELTASDGAASDLFGWSVWVDGSTAVVGADARNSYRGATYIFTQSGSTWTQQQELTASDGAANDSFGWAVAVSGNTVLSGAYNHNSYEGSAYVFTVPASLSVSARQNQIFQAGPAVILLDVTNAGNATVAAATLSDTIDPAFTIDDVTSGCTVSGQTVTCTIPAGIPAGTYSPSPGIFMTTSPTAAASIANPVTLTDTTDAVTTPTYTQTITVSPEAPLADSSLSQQVLSGSTDNGPCADGYMKLTATDLLQNTSGSTLSYPYAVISALSGGNTLLTQAASSTSVAAGDSVTFTFHIKLASCNTFQLFFDVRSN